MIDWLIQTPAIAASVLVVFVPGLLVGVALGLRGLTLWAFAPAISTAVLTVSALILGLVGVGWRPVPAIAATLAVTALAAAVRFGLRLGSAPAKRATPRFEWVVFGAGIVTGIGLTAARVGLYIVQPAAVSQTNDGSFHLNALRFAVETGAASPLQVTSMIGANSFYPSGWHVLASLVPQLTGASVEVAANTVSLVIAAVAWPLGVALLTRAIGGTIAAGAAAALSAAVPAFPLLMLQWGVLYPQLLAVAVLPAAIAMVVLWSDLRGEAAAGSIRSTPRPAVLVTLGVAAILVSQPSVFLAWAVAALAFAAMRLITRWAAVPVRARVGAIAALVVAAVATAMVWWLFGRSIAGTWPPTTGRVATVIEVVANGYLGYPWAVATSILMVIGIIEGIRRPHLRWLVATWVIFAGLYFVAASIANPLVRGLLVGPWYEDPYRLAALAPVAVLPLAGIGAVALVRWIVSTGLARTPAVSVGAIVVIALVGVTSIVTSPQIARRDVFARTIDPNLYAVTSDSFLSTDELAVLERLDRSLPEDAIVIGNPSTGMSFGYALSGRNVVPRTWQPPPGAEYQVLWTSLRDAASDPAVCPALAAFGAKYVLDFGPGEAYPGRWVMPGFDDLDGQPGFEMIDREGDASLWRVTACG